MIRAAMPADLPAMTAVLNEIIATGGTTAHQTEFTETGFRAHYLDGQDAVCCHLAEADGRVVGFQVLGFYPALPEGWLDIGTFVSASFRGTGAGAALFAGTKAVAQDRGCGVINATIRADNLPGIGFYTRLGFKDYASDAEFALKDGRRVGRISKRYDLV